MYFSWGCSKIVFCYIPDFCDRHPALKINLKIFYLKNKNQLTNSKKKNNMILLFDGTNLNSREYRPGNPKRAQFNSGRRNFYDCIER